MISLTSARSTLPFGESFLGLPIPNKLLSISETVSFYSYFLSPCYMSLLCCCQVYYFCSHQHFTLSTNRWSCLNFKPFLVCVIILLLPPYGLVQTIPTISNYPLWMTRCVLHSTTLFYVQPDAFYTIIHFTSHMTMNTRCQGSLDC